MQRNQRKGVSFGGWWSIVYFFRDPFVLLQDLKRSTFSWVVSASKPLVSRGLPSKTVCFGSTKFNQKNVPRNPLLLAFYAGLSDKPSLVHQIQV